EPQPDTNPARLLALIGASGSGKSSAMMAGLLPQLERGTLPGSEQWVYLEPMKPGAHPLEALVLTLALHFPERSVESLREELNDESALGLHSLASCLVKMPGQVGALPLLQFKLEQLFQRRSDHLLTLQAYREMGGVKGALAKQAESTYTSLPSQEHQRLARTLFLRLIDPGPTEQETTR